MGFGPNLPSTRQAVQAVLDIVSLLYPERATKSALAVLEDISTILLEAKAPMSFQSIHRLLAGPAWREEILARAPDRNGRFSTYTGKVIDPAWLDRDFAWLLHDRLKALSEGGDA